MGPAGPVPAPQEGPETAHDLAAVEARRRLTPEGLPRASRLARASEIRRVLAGGRRHRTEFLDVIWADNAAGHPRIGLIVPRYQSSAVARNRLRRRLREIWRRDLQARTAAWDVIIRARPPAYRASFGQLRSDLEGWPGTAQRAG